MITSLIALTVLAPPPLRVLPGRWEGSLQPAATTTASETPAPTPILTKATLQLDRKGTFSLRMGLEMRGRWQYAGQVITLLPESVGGRTLAAMGTTMDEANRQLLAAPIDLIVSDNGRELLTPLIGTEPSPQMLFRRRR